MGKPTLELFLRMYPQSDEETYNQVFNPGKKVSAEIKETPKPKQKKTTRKTVAKKKDIDI